MSSPDVAYLVFDIESVADGDLVSKIRYEGQFASGEEAVAAYRAELLEKYESDFIPYTYQVPVSIVVAKVTADFRLVDLVALDEPAYRSHVMTEHFWRGWEQYGRPTLVSFNGRTFDLPLLELAAFRYGIQVPTWFNLQAKAYDHRRNRYNTTSHLDLYDLLTNFGASRFNGGLNLAANLIGKPGKMEVQGHMVQDLHAENRGRDISDYCRCDVLDTYFVFLRCQVMMGHLTLEAERELVDAAKQWIGEHAGEHAALRLYLEQWGDWSNPWDEPATSEMASES